MPPCNDQQRSQSDPQACNWVRSELSRKVGLNNGEKVIRDKAFSEELSGQSRIWGHCSRRSFCRPDS
jgi:hypothetical protein